MPLPKVNLALGEIFVKYKSFLQSTGYSKSTVKNYFSDLNYFGRWLRSLHGEDFNLQALTDSDIQNFQRYIKHEFRSKPTIAARRISSLATFLTWAKEEGFIQVSKVRSLSPILKDPDDTGAISKFREYLKINGYSAATTKNYVADIRHLIAWISANHEKFQLTSINERSVRGYRSHLKDKFRARPSIAARRLSSLRKFLLWAKKNGIYAEDLIASVEKVLSEPAEKLPAEALSPVPALTQPTVETPVGVIPNAPTVLPGRTPISSIPDKSIKTPYTSTNLYQRITYSISNRVTERLVRPIQHRPIRYAILAVLILVAANFMFGNTIDKILFQQQQNEKEIGDLLAATTPPRVLSFQGRLTDSSDVPVSISTNIVFRIYTSTSGDTGSPCASTCLWESKTWAVTPDQNGIFSVLLGDTSQSDTVIPATLFSENDPLYLSVKVESDAEMTPRQRIASSAYALNSDALEGFHGSQSPGADQVPILDGSGNLVFGGAATISTSTGSLTLDSPNEDVIITLSGAAGDDFIVDTDTLVVESDNNRVGIGTTEPDTLLHVDGGYLTVESAGTTTAAKTIIQNSNEDTSLLLWSGSSAGVDTPAIVYSTGDDLRFGTATAGSITAASFVERARLNSVGNLQLDGDIDIDGNDITSAGDLTITPAGQDTLIIGRLNVNSTTVSGDPHILDLNDTNAGDTGTWFFAIARAASSWVPGSNAGSLVLRSSQTDDDFIITADGGLTTSFKVTSTNLVGIGGVTTPLDPLHVRSDSGGDAIHIEENIGGEDWQLGVDSTGDLNFENSGTVAVRFEDTSDIYFYGTTLTGSAFAIDDGSDEIYVGDNIRIGQNSSTDDDSIYFDTTTTEYLRWDEADTTYEPGFELSDALQIFDDLYIGTSSGADNDFIYFDGSKAESLHWDNTDFRFEFSDDVFSTQQIQGDWLSDHSGFASDGTTALCKGATYALLVYDCSGAPVDYAEYYGTKAGIEPGDVVKLNDNKVLNTIKTSQPYDNKVFGIVSTNPHDPLGIEKISSEDNPRPVALSGRVPVKVNLENGKIKIGDRLTTSSTPGVAMKATEDRVTIGIALETYDASQQISDEVISVHEDMKFDPGEKPYDDKSQEEIDKLIAEYEENNPLPPSPPEGIGKIMVFVDKQLGNNTSEEIRISKIITKEGKIEFVFDEEDAEISFIDNLGNKVAYISSAGEIVAERIEVASARVTELVAGDIFGSYLEIVPEVGQEFALLIKSAGGEEVASINPEGNVKAKSLETENIIPVGESAGSAVLKAGETEVLVETESVREESLIFVTPTIKTTGVLAVTDIKPEESFKVENYLPAETDIEFNWWVVQRNSLDPP